MACQCLYVFYCTCSSLVLVKNNRPALDLSLIIRYLGFFCDVLPIMAIPGSLKLTG